MSEPVASLSRPREHSSAPRHHGVHDHDPDHGHHDHVQDHPDLVPAQPAVPAFSLLTLSLAQRLAGAAALSVLLWVAVFWALK